MIAESGPGRTSPNSIVETDPSDTPAKVVAFLFGAGVYLGVWVILIYVLCFVGNFFNPLFNTRWDAVLPLKSIDSGEIGPFWPSFWIDLGLVAILGLQHSIMPRPWFKTWLTKLVPPHMERGVYIIFATAALSLLIWQWRPIPQVVWHVDNPILRIVLFGIQVFGWILVPIATSQVGHWKIFGITQTLDFIRDRPYIKQTYPRLQPEFYEVGWPISAKGVWHYARHPDFFGFITAFWVTPTMTFGHLVFAVGLTTYIMFGIFFLETNLKQLYGKPYEEYVRVRSKIVPWFVRKAG